MKKLFILAVAAASLIGTASFAEESYVAGGFEASGHVVAGAGWQRFKASTSAAAVAAGTNAVANDVNGNLPGVIGAYADSTQATVGGVNKEDVFKFFVDEFELDLAKSFGENIRIRADLDFGSKDMASGPRFGIGAPAEQAGVAIEQAYATANIGIGNGVEVLLGRFNVPMGFEKVDVNQNDSISRSVLYRALRPNTMTGLKVYYAFSDLVDWSFYVANNSLTHDANDVLGKNTDIPAFGHRLGFNWGEEGKKSTIGVSGAVGQDHGDIKKHMSFVGDLDFNWWATEHFAVGGEALYRQVNKVAGTLKNNKYLGGLLNLHYDFSDVWDGTLKYAFAKEANVPGGNTVANLTGTGAQSLVGGKGVIHEMVLAGNYAIMDGAKVKLEGGYTMINPTGPSNNQHVFGFGGAFAYEF